jgi:C-terminal peptidase prc
METVTAAGVAEALRYPLNGAHELELGADTPAVVLPLVVPTVYGIGVVNSKEGIGYIRVGAFSAGTSREIDEALTALKLRGVRVLVLDLRGNIGGSFMAGVETARRFLPAGLIVTTQGHAGEVANRVFSSESGMSAHDIPLVVLIDAETASAAEVLAVALKDNNRATLVGMQSFGKGAIQYPLALDSLDEKDAHGKPKTARSGTVRLTIARLIAPRGATINGVGVTPHIIEADPARQLEIAFEKAVELLPSANRPMPVMPVIP